MKHLKKFNESKQDILDILGKNLKNPVELLSATRHDQPYGVYTHKGEVFVFKSSEDIPFDELTKAEQTAVINDIKSGKYKTNKYLQ